MNLSVAEENYFFQKVIGKFLYFFFTWFCYLNQFCYKKNVGLIGKLKKKIGKFGKSKKNPLISVCGDLLVILNKKKIKISAQMDYFTGLL